ncbi:MAG: glycosyltransferase family 4 protein [Patescibacteria group bacterium]|jgi:glycosyltransferase involved in cell wall biosynthesis
MKISQLVSCLNPVSSATSSAIYSHVGALCDGLTIKGHKVFLYASGDSQTNAELVSVYPIALNLVPKISEREKNFYTDSLISKCYKNASKYDLIHSHFTILSSFYQNFVKTPTLISVHSPIDKIMKTFLKEFKSLRYISFSLAQRKQMPELNWYANIYHGVDTKKFAFNPNPEDYFLYLGRVTEDKGAHLAIEAAKKAGVKLVIAGRSYQGEGYWHSHIEKNIDGKNITYIGEQNSEQKIPYLQKAKGLIFPTQCEEVFGYSMIEAMSCGTPVIGWNIGAIPEVIKDGKTGYVVNSVEEMAEAMKNIDNISRKETRTRAEAFFSIKKMITGYQNVYQRVLGEIAYKKDRRLKKEKDALKA